MAPFSNEERQSSAIQQHRVTEKKAAIIMDQADIMESGEGSNSSLGPVKVKCVCFDNEPEVHFIETIDEIPDYIFESLWFNDDEMKGMIAAASKVIDGTNKEDLPRGLEHCSYEGAQRRRSERAKASEAVLGEQLRQKAAKACDDVVFANADELIAQEYRKVSKKQQDLAFDRACSDEAEATGKLFVRPLAGLKRWFASDRHLDNSNHQPVVQVPSIL